MINAKMGIIKHFSQSDLLVNTIIIAFPIFNEKL